MVVLSDPTNIDNMLLVASESLAQKRWGASLTAVSGPTGNGFSGWKHVKFHFLRVHMDTTYR